MAADPSIGPGLLRLERPAERERLVADRLGLARSSPPRGTPASRRRWRTGERRLRLVRRGASARGRGGAGRRDAQAGHVIATADKFGGFDRTWWLRSLVGGQTFLSVARAGWPPRTPAGLPLSPGEAGVRRTSIRCESPANASRGRPVRPFALTPPSPRERVPGPAFEAAVWSRVTDKNVCLRRARASRHVLTSPRSRPARPLPWRTACPGTRPASTKPGPTLERLERADHLGRLGVARTKLSSPDCDCTISLSRPARTTRRTRPSTPSTPKHFAARPLGRPHHARLSSLTRYSVLPSRIGGWNLHWNSFFGPQSFCAPARSA
jgi:hypothetical protein